MFEQTKTGYENEKEENYFTEFITENDYYVTIQLNSFKDKMIFMACTEEIGNIFYSKEYTYKELSKISQVLKIEKSLEKMHEVISRSIYYNEIKSNINRTHQTLDLEIPLMYNDENNKGKIKATFQLNRIIRSKEDIIDSLIDKVDFLIREKNNYLKGYKIKKLLDENKVENIETRINSLEKSINLLEQNSKIFIDSNLISCSNIINILDDWNIITERLKKIEPKYNNILFKLVYRATRDGDSAENFHKKCDKIGPNITLVLTINNIRFGGFTKNNWEHLKEDINQKDPEIGSGKDDADAFCFSIDLHKIYNNIELDSGVVFCCNKYGPTFCRNIFSINDNMLTKGGFCLKKKYSCFDGQESDYEISGGKKVFGVKDVEVLEILFV